MTRTETGPGEGVQSLPQGLDGGALHKLAAENPATWLAIAEHPNAYPDLLEWLANVGPIEVQEAVARRKARGLATEAPVEDSATRLAAPVRPAPVSAAPAQPAPATLSQPIPVVASPAAAAPASVAPASVAPVKPAPVKPAPASSESVAPSFEPRSPLTSRPLPSRTKMTRPAATAASPVRPVPAAAPAIQSPSFTDDLDDRTMLAKRVVKRPVLARLSWDGLRPEDLISENVLIGRKVRPDMAGEGEQVVLVEERTKTVSGKHARLTRENGVWMIEDLDSTNGTDLIERDGTEHRITSRERVTQDFYLGDVKFHFEEISQDGK